MPLTAEAIFRRRLLSAVLLPFVLMMLLAGVSIWQISRLLVAMRWVEHTDQVIAQANYTQKLLLDLETGVRGYLLSGEVEFLAPYQQASTTFEPALHRLERLVSDNPAQVQQLKQVRAHYETWNQFVPMLLELGKSGSTEPISILRTRKQLVDQMRKEFTEFISVEEQLRNRRIQVAQRTTQLVITSSSGLALLIGIVMAYFLRRQLLNVSHSYEVALSTVEKRTERLAILHTIDKAILSIESIDALIRTALNLIQQAVQVQHSFVVLFDFETQTAQVITNSADNGSPLLQSPLLPLTAVAPVALIQQRQPRYIEDITALNSRYPVLDELAAAGVHSYLSVPLINGDRLLGELGLAAPQQAAFDEEAQAIASEVASQLAIAVQQAGLRQQLQAYTIELEQRVSERTAQLQETNEELEAFTYSVSHDLRAPLRTIQGFAQALLEDFGTQLDEIGKSYIQSIIEDSIQMDTLISDLLAYSRLTRTEVRLHPTNLNSVIQEVLNQLTTQWHDRHAQIVVEPSLPLVMAHRPILVQVITNLLSNAIKFVEPEIQPQIRVWAEEQTNYKQIRLWVQDNGIGIAPDYQERIFRPFERLHGIESYPGTGIGLAIVRKGVERMGGQAGVESQLGQGSRFWIALPKAVLHSP